MAMPEDFEKVDWRVRGVAAQGERDRHRGVLPPMRASAADSVRRARRQGPARSLHARVALRGHSARDVSRFVPANSRATSGRTAPL